MGFGDGFAVVPTVIKREDYKRTKHDAVFFNWQVLIGTNDWEDFKNGKDGVGRYRVQNLPRKSCPGLYELGVAVILQDQGRRRDSDDVLPAYLGQAESVRSRLQSYGRSGAHLRNVNSCETLDKKAVTPGLFEDIFSKGGSILYRWAPMGSKREAEATEGMLLSTFDYAWNKGSNGQRRHLDLLKKLGDREFMSNRTSGISRVLFPFRRNQVGIRIKGEKHALKEETMLSYGVDKEKTTNFLTSILKFSRSRPQPVSNRVDEKHKPPQRQPEILRDCKDSDVICGVILPEMEPCSKRPVPGRKRCEDHKGMRINAFLFLLNQEDREITVKDEKFDPELHTDINEEVASTRFCEATTKNGLPCTRSSPKGSKRCWQHKEIFSGNTSPGKSQAVAGKHIACGVKLCNGLICERSPVKGRKRCEEHKGMRITSSQP